ncbi:hypothetical protein J0383_18845 [Flavobacterium endoglycinae]|uniref:Uncharacterized protein n=1 Tax=Flavobacterium endoglycinae TaxID=2816357 RepID=A0ABX7QCH3_9FLAO|nr:hypothetical protein [Flavobacterium endoglycinae]QSW88308.1 hypothetical protein J0383_18845 [Flavobacterium endoglycinae]
MFDLEILDKILSTLSQPNTKKATKLDLSVILRKDPIIHLYYNEFILEKNIERLLEENYIKEVAEDVHIRDFGTHSVTYYTLTTIGYIFIKEKGYQNTYYSNLSIEQENRELRKSQIELNKSVVETNKRTLKLTSWIAFGTIVAAVYYLVELYLVFHPYNTGSNP